MNLLDYESFILEDEESKKIEKLLRYWNLENPILQGEIFSIGERNNFFFIENVKTLDGERYITNPFKRTYKFSVFCGAAKKGEINDIIQGMKIGDKIIFSFKINESKGEDQPIAAIPCSIRKLKDLEELASEKDLSIIEVIKETKIKNPYIEKVMFKEDFEAELSKIIGKVEDTVTDYNTIINAKKDELNDIVEKLADVKKEYDATKAEKENLIDKEVSSYKELKNKEKVEIRKKISKLNKEKSEIEETIKQFEAFGFKFRDTDNSIKIQGISNVPKEKHIDYIQKYLGVSYKKHLYYNRETLEQFYGALCTNQIVILSGAPGTGKTSLVEGFCNAIGAEKRIISVQPNWTDNQDLVGFYNPIEKVYISTPFLDAIIEAKENEEQLYVICLDEMNLAHVEYYFSEFLSKLESHDRKLELYSKYIYDKTREEIEEKIDYLINKEYVDLEISIEEKLNLIKKEDTENYYKLKWQWDFINKYPAELVMPSNVRFVATINKDETTKDLSPKVIDRSYIMEITPYKLETKREFIENEKKYRKTYEKNLYLESNKFKYSKGLVSQDVEKKLEAIKELLLPIKVTLNNRFYEQLDELLGADIYNEENIFDYIVSAKILPKINLQLNTTHKDNINAVERLLKDTIISKDIFASMKEYWEQHYILTFWR